MTVGVISDTHGLLRPEAVEALRGTVLILHAGDVGDRRVLESLEAVAPVRAVRGNMDWGPVSALLPETAAVNVGGHRLYVIHDLERLALDPAAAGFDAVISGHTHRPLVEWRGGVLYLNPGSAGPRRGSLPVSLALLEVEPSGLRARIVALEESGV